MDPQDVLLEADLEGCLNENLDDVNWLEHAVCTAQAPYPDELDDSTVATFAAKVQECVGDMVNTSSH